MILDKLVFEEKIGSLTKAFPGRIDRQDGLRISTPDWWLHIRPSNTEPIVRIIGEGMNRADVERRIRIAKKILTQD